MAADGDEFYLRYYVEGASNYAGREVMKIEVTVDRESGGGRLRYSNESRYKGSDLIRKEVCLSALVVKELRRIIQESDIMAEDDSQWPQPSREHGTQELEIKLGTQHISFTVSGHRMLTTFFASLQPSSVPVSVAFSFSVSFSPHPPTPPPPPFYCNCTPSFD